MQGYIGMAAADPKEQVIVGAKAAGSANEGAHFPDMLKNALSNVEKAGFKKRARHTGRRVLHTTGKMIITNARPGKNLSVKRRGK